MVLFMLVMRSVNSADVWFDCLLFTVVVSGSLLSALKCTIPSILWIKNSPVAEIWFLVACDGRLRLFLRASTDHQVVKVDILRRGLPRGS